MELYIVLKKITNSFSRITESFGNKAQDETKAAKRTSTPTNRDAIHGLKPFASESRYVAGQDSVATGVLPRNKTPAEHVPLDLRATETRLRTGGYLTGHQYLGNVDSDGNCFLNSLISTSLPTLKRLLNTNFVTPQRLRTAMAHSLLDSFAKYNIQPAKDQELMKKNDHVIDMIEAYPCAYDLSTPERQAALVRGIGEEDIEAFMALTPNQQAHIASIAIDGAWDEMANDLVPLVASGVLKLPITVLSESRDGIAAHPFFPAGATTESIVLYNRNLPGSPQHYQPVLKRINSN